MDGLAGRDALPLTGAVVRRGPGDVSLKRAGLLLEGGIREKFRMAAQLIPRELHEGFAHSD
jgi:hypothetical protein